MGFGRYLARKVVYIFILLIVIIMFNFVLFQVLPFVVSCRGVSFATCAAELYVPPPPPHIGAGGNVSAVYNHMKAQILRNYGFDQPITTRFVLYIQDLLTFRFGYNVGTSGQSGPVINTIQQRAPFTVLLLGASTIAAFGVGIGTGVIAAAKRGKLLDISSLAVLLFVNALPVFFLAVILVLGQIKLTGLAYISEGAATLGVTGLKYYSAILSAFWLPFLTLTIAGIGSVFLTQRAVMIDTMAEDYVLMARAKGVPERTVLFKHAFRNAVLPIVTAFAISVGFILSGAIITETVFGWPGLGSALYEAIQTVNFPLEQAMFYMITLMVLICLFIADISLGLLDPRVSTG